MLSAYVPTGHSVTVTQDLVELSAYLSNVHCERQAFSFGEANSAGTYGHFSTHFLVELTAKVFPGHSVTQRLLT